MWRQGLKKHYDIAIVGSGFGGSLMAMVARRLNLSVVLLERGKHPRVVIGESSTPLSNLLLEKLSIDYDLPQVVPLSKWGSWQRAYPHIGCGLKRGFTFFHHTLGHADVDDPEHTNQLLVAASPHDVVSDTHWYRADFDHFLVNEAKSLGVDFMDEVRLETVDFTDDDVTILGCQGNETLHIQAKFLMDATGPRGFLHRALQLGEAPLPGFPHTQAVYSHFTGVKTTESAEPTTPPYPVDDAAVHHVFDGGWVWVLRFNNGITSVGVAATDAVADRLALSEGKAAWTRLLDFLPSLKMQFRDATAVRPFTHIPRLAFRNKTVAGPRWAMLPSAAGFVDPLLSTGFPLTLMGIARLGQIISKHWNSASFAEQLQRYAQQADDDLLASARLIGALYANMGNFRVFAALSLLYFAAVSFSETAYRLGKPELASSFLLHRHPSFGPASTLLVERAHKLETAGDTARFINEVIRLIEPFNLGDYGNPARRNWYPVLAEDLLNNGWKLGATQEEITSMLVRSDFRQ